MTPERMLELQAEREEHLRECESCRLQGLEDPPTEESLASQRLLREVLLRNPDLLDQWMQREIMLHLSESGLEEARPSASETEILKPVVETLSRGLRHQFREALARGELYDAAPEFYESFHIGIADVTIEKA
jgi:hypothetical protein